MKRQALLPRQLRQAFLVLACIGISLALFSGGRVLINGDIDGYGTSGTVVDLQSAQNFLPAVAEVDEAGSLRFAVASMWSVRSTFLRYHELVERIARDVGRRESFVLRSSYSDLRHFMEQGQIDAAFICTGPYVLLEPTGNIELLVQPQFIDGLSYRSLILAPRDSGLLDLLDLRGRTVAFASSESFTGCLVPAAELLSRDLHPVEFFADIMFTGNHERSLHAVDRGVVDAAAVQSIVWWSAQQQDPELSRRLRVIWSSDVFGVPPVVVRRDLEEELKNDLRNAFLQLHQDSSGRQLLHDLNIQHFTTPTAADYASALLLYERLLKVEKVMSWLSLAGL